MPDPFSPLATPHLPLNDKNNNTPEALREGLWKIYKPVGWTSFDVVARIRALTRIKKVGHAGTLDPAAEGLLLVAIGRNATKHLDELLNMDKEYIADITLGISTDSADRDGTVIERCTVTVSKEQVEKVIPSLIGQQDQVPPMHSAIKVNGKKLYELARKGKTVERKARTIEVKEVELLNFIPGDNPAATVRFLCSKGTYIRVLAEKTGELLGVPAYLSGLKRTKIGEYTLENAITVTSGRNTRQAEDNAQ